MAILKALEYIQYSNAGEKAVLVYTDSRITLQLLQNQKKHTHLIEQIRTKVIELEQHKWKVNSVGLRHMWGAAGMSWQTNW